MSYLSHPSRLLLLLALPAAPLAAQTPVDSGTFVVRHGEDTVATERFTRRDTNIEGVLAIRNYRNTSQRYTAVIAPDATVPMIDVAVREDSDSGRVKQKLVQRARVIFREDSAAVDAIISQNIETRVFGTQRGAIPYLNMSFALLEQAVRRTRTAGAAADAVPFFNLGGGQTVSAKVKPVGVPQTKAAIVSIKGKNATIKVSPNGIPPTKSQIQSIKGKNVTIQVQQNGVGSVRSQINAIQGKTVFVRVKKEEANAVGGVIGWSKGLPGYATGGVVRGRGGPKEDNIAMLDRATGVQTAWGSVGEMLVNAAQTKKNKEALQAINAGGTWDVVPRYAEGGTIGSTGAPRSVARSLTLNLDLGPVFGGVQRMVIDLMDDRDEYSASIGRMR